jgi:hypothetical protein
VLQRQQELTRIIDNGVLDTSRQSLQYLRQKDLPCRQQNAKQIAQILEAIGKVKCNPDQPGARGSNALTKTEKLMMVNIAPVSLVDLTIVCLAPQLPPLLHHILLVCA